MPRSFQWQFAKQDYRAWNKEQYATNGGQIWPLVEDLSYTNEDLKTAAMGGFPLGDLRWFPDAKAQWEAQADAEHTRINTWLETGEDPGVVDVKLANSGLPNNYALSQNYPNPFNPTTKIEYSIPKAGYVSLKVYNSLGELVTTLFAGQQHPGNYVATFDGSHLASGVYLYEFRECFYIQEICSYEIIINFLFNPFPVQVLYSGRDYILCM